MPSIFILCAFATLSSLGFALPGVSATITTSLTATTTVAKTTKTSCTSVTKSTANFDALPTGSAPPSDYGLTGLDWDGGWSVVSASDNNLKASSGSNIVQAPAYGPSLVYSNALVYGADIESFTFACTAPFYNDGTIEQIPADCKLLVVSELDEFGSSLAAYGPYTYTACASPPCKMTKVAFSGSIGSQLSFMLTSGPSFGYFYLDNVVISATNSNCP